MKAMEPARKGAVQNVQTALAWNYESAAAATGLKGGREMVSRAWPTRNGIGNAFSDTNHPWMSCGCFSRLHWASKTGNSAAASFLGAELVNDCGCETTMPE